MMRGFEGEIFFQIYSSREKKSIWVAVLKLKTRGDNLAGTILVAKSENVTKSLKCYGQQTRGTVYQVYPSWYTNCSWYTTSCV